MPHIGWLFPGQGSQFIGMGKELIGHFPEAQALYAQADKILGFPLSRIILEGPEEELKRTDVAQPAIFTTTLAAWSVLKTAGVIPWENSLAAGHSLGEYSALCAAGVLDFASGLRLVRRRGELMQQAGQANPGGMAAVIGMTESEVASLCQEANANQEVQIANLNCPGQVVVSGSKPGLEQLTQLAQTRKVRVMPLAVSGPFHSRFMASAGQVLAAELDKFSFQPPIFPVVANFSAQPVRESKMIKELLIQQVSGTVRWQESIQTMLAQGVTLMIEVGPGKVLRGLLKKITSEIKTLGAFTPDEVLILIKEMNKIPVL